MHFWLTNAKAQAKDKLFIYIIMVLNLVERKNTRFGEERGKIINNNGNIYDRGPYIEIFGVCIKAIGPESWV